MDFLLIVLMLGAHICCLIAFISAIVSKNDTNYIKICGIVFGTTSIYLYTGDNIEMYTSYFFIMLSFLYLSIIKD